MDCTAKCRICGIKLTCNDGVYTLGDHLIKKHPEIDMNHYVMENCGDGFKDNKNRKKLSNKFSLASTLLRKSSTFIKGRKKDGSAKKGLYKTTVESWRPGSNPLTCPKCNNTDQPYIRKQRNKVAYNSLGAFFLLGCWPLCFLPMLVTGGADTIVCCKKCGYCFGTYDKSKGKLIPTQKETKVEPPNFC